MFAIDLFIPIMSKSTCEILWAGLLDGSCVGDVTLRHRGIDSRVHLEILAQCERLTAIDGVILVPDDVDRECLWEAVEFCYLGNPPSPPDNVEHFIRRLSVGVELGLPGYIQRAAERPPAITSANCLYMGMLGRLYGITHPGFLQAVEETVVASFGCLDLVRRCLVADALPDMLAAFYQEAMEVLGSAGVDRVVGVYLWVPPKYDPRALCLMRYDCMPQRDLTAACEAITPGREGIYSVLSEAGRSSDTMDVVLWLGQPTKVELSQTHTGCNTAEVFLDSVGPGQPPLRTINTCPVNMAAAAVAVRPGPDGRPGTEVYILRNSVFAVFDSMSGTWRQLPAPPTERENHGMVFVDRNRLYVVGGIVSGRVDVYNADKGQWREDSSIEGPPDNCPTLLVDGEYLYVFYRQKQPSESHFRMRVAALHISAGFVLFEAAYEMCSMENPLVAVGPDDLIYVLGRGRLYYKHCMICLVYDRTENMMGPGDPKELARYMVENNHHGLVNGALWGVHGQYWGAGRPHRSNMWVPRWNPEMLDWEHPIALPDYSCESTYCYYPPGPVVMKLPRAHCSGESSSLKLGIKDETSMCEEAREMQRAKEAAHRRKCAGWAPFPCL